jgi:hypothetical protein
MLSPVIDVWKVEAGEQPAKLPERKEPFPYLNQRISVIVPTNPIRYLTWVSTCIFCQAALARPVRM